MPRILFLPNFLGGGFGHIGRCLALAEAWTRRGGEAVIVVGGRHAQRVLNAGIRVEILETRIKKASQAAAPAYTYVPDMAYQVVRDGFDHPSRIWQVLWDLEKIMERVQPDLLVGDGFLLTGLLGRKLGLPVAQIVKTVVHPLSTAQIASWESTPPGLIIPDIRHVFNPVLSRLGQPEVEAAAQLLVGDIYLMAGGMKRLDPLDPIPERTYWPGALLRQTKTEEKAAWINDLPHNRPVIYVTIGGATLQGDWSALAKLVFKALGRKGWTVVFSTGGTAKLQNPINQENIILRPWVPTRQMLRRCNAVVFHGGYTRLEVLSEGKPSIILPGHSEQEYYGRLLETAGAAKVLALSDDPYICHKVSWRGGRLFGKSQFTVFTRHTITLHPERLCQAVEQALEDPDMRNQAENMDLELSKRDGCEQALDLIERLAS